MKVSVADLDISMFRKSDLINLCYQRSSAPTEAMQRQIMALDDGPEFDRLRTEIIQFVLDEIAENLAAVAQVFDKVRPKSLADIGCGYAFIDLMIYRRYGAKLVLIDIEKTDTIYFMYNEKGAGYSNLATARAFLEANGVPSKSIVTINPETTDLARAPKVDMAMSLLSCGFHYPVATYADFFHSHVGKALLLDIRRRKPQGRDLMDEWGSSRILHRGIKHDSIAALRW
jgi:SAM-dependent methyltransferase